MSMIYYEDLLSVPFKLNGRDSTGMDCYGICIEMCRRNGKELKDLLCIHVNENELPVKVASINIVEIPETEIKAGDLVQCTWNKELHIAFMLDKKCVIHATEKGVRITPILALINRKYFRVV